MPDNTISTRTPIQAPTRLCTACSRIHEDARILADGRIMHCPVTVKPGEPTGCGSTTIGPACDGSYDCDDCGLFFTAAVAEYTTTATGERDTYEVAAQKLRDLFATYQGQVIRFLGNGFSEGDVESWQIAANPDRPLYLRIESIDTITDNGAYVDLDALCRPLDPTHPALVDDVAQEGVVVRLLTWITWEHRYYTYDGDHEAWKLVPVAG